MDREREMEPISISIDSIPAFVNGGPVFPIDSVPTFNGGPVHPIDSITTFINGGSVHHHLDQPEHTISQSLLILCCLTAVSSLHYEIGDTRSLEDFLQREEDAWWPRVGTEDYNGLQDAQTEQIISWEGCTAAFESTFAQHDGPTFHELRSQLRHILEEIGQLATWPPQPAFAGLRQLTSKHFDWKMSLWLVLFSCATTPATSRLSAEFWNTQQHDLQQLAMFLNTSPLFRTPLTVNDLKDWIEKLELVFCGPRRENSPQPTPIYVVTFYLCEEDDDAFITHFRQLPGRSTLCRTTSSEPAKHQYRCISEQDESSSSPTSEDLIIGNQQPTYHEAIPCSESARQHWTEIVRESSVLLDHRCPRPVSTVSVSGEDQN